MPADLPGYHFDPTTNRYYKIQANHIAPSGASYSRQAVNAAKVIKRTQHQKEVARRSKHASTITRSKVSQTPLLSFDRRLGNLRTSARTYVREYYAASLSGADAFSRPVTMPRILGHEYTPSGLAEQFAVDESSGSLLTAQTYRAAGERTLSLLLAFDRPQQHQLNSSSASVVRDEHFYDTTTTTNNNNNDHNDSNDDDEDDNDIQRHQHHSWPMTFGPEQPSNQGHLYSPHNRRILQSAPKVDCLKWIGPRLVCWTHETPQGPPQLAQDPNFGLDPDMTQMDPELESETNYYENSYRLSQSDLILSHYSSASSSDSGSRAIGLDMVVKLRFQARILDLAIPPTSNTSTSTSPWGSSSSSSPNCLAIATSSGVSVMTDLEYAQHVTQTPVRGEQTKVAFKDSNVIMAGSRTGRLVLCDSRTSTTTSTTTTSTSSSSSSALRIQHSSAISGIEPLPDGNRVLVNGLTDMKIYDLRFISAPTRNPPTTHSHKHKHHHYQPSKYNQRVNTPSTPVVTFNVDQTRRQNRYGLAFAYDPELDIVLSASTDNLHNHRVGLWSAASGQLLDPCPLNDCVFKEPVTCAEIVRLRDGPKSILLASAGKLEEWGVQGRGFERDQE
ncbi:hypothetical protein ABEF95_001882 [Exophiala dermatitidis]